MLEIYSPLNEANTTCGVFRGPGGMTAVRFAMMHSLPTINRLINYRNCFGMDLS